MTQHTHQFILRSYDGKYMHCLECGSKERIVPPSPIKAILCKGCGEPFIAEAESEQMTCVKCRKVNEQ